MDVTLPARAEVSQDSTWDLSSVFASVVEWEAACNSVEDEIPKLAAFRGRLAGTAQVLFEWLFLSSKASEATDRAMMWADCSSDEDTADQERASRVARIMAISSRVQAAMAFAKPEILAIGETRIREFIDGYAPLAPYRHYFDTIFRQAKHTRSGEIEEVLAQARLPFATSSTAYTLLCNAEMRFADAVDSQGRTYEVAQGTIEELLHSGDRSLRETAWKSFADGFLAAKSTIAALLCGKGNSVSFTARVRQFPDPLTASLTPKNIPVTVYENVINACNKHVPLWHRYWEIRRRALGVERLSCWDVFAPLGKGYSLSYPEAVSHICRGLEPLGSEYVEAVRKGCTAERWIDYARNTGKRSGAYSSGAYGTRPFILMSYSEQAGVSSMSTLAHELGHSMHSLLTNRKQPYVYSNYSIFVAEVASNFDQALVRAYLLRTVKEPEFRRAILEEAMQNFHRYFFLMPILSQFELHLHQSLYAGRSLGADEMSAYTEELFKRGFGDAVDVDGARLGITWAQFPHLYSEFYVWQYASGIGAANVLAAAVDRGDTGARERYLQFLEAGSSLDPLDALSGAGVDLRESNAL
jgi:oligoendopeptidase F